MKLAARLDRMGTPLYAGLTKQTKGGAVWTGEMRKASEDVLLAPLRRKKPTTYFVNSMSDLFHEKVPSEWIDEIFAVMALSPQHTFQVLTKRADRMKNYVTMARAHPVALVAMERAFSAMARNPKSKLGAGIVLHGDIMHLKDWPLPNVWLGVSTEDQRRADQRIPLLMQTPAAVRFISAEPLLGPIKLWHVSDRSEFSYPDLSWVIIGGESGHGYRRMDPAWAYDLRDQCVAADVPVFIKQMAGRAPIPDDLMLRQFPRTI